MARPEYEAGRMPPGTKLAGISMVFNRSTAQESALQSLIAAQQDPASPLYHQWLTPDQFAARFGVADVDIAKVQFWLCLLYTSGHGGRRMFLVFLRIPLTQFHRRRERHPARHIPANRIMR